ncbi:YggT family protein [Rarobacter faecitabidus]|uniref:YggT family protein n=1 Tax=Rarobacter faecitabidus TaxID=13243 RepID=A0A542ZW87_RARFA|nr:YggT family protein [Rarobacter faecitabidus]TQL64611.1 YggT family protein [Rarobacter faecitabidus]
MHVVWWLLSWLLMVFLLLLLVRAGLSWVQVLARDFRPRGVALFVAEITYTVTDPPLKVARKVIPSIALGRIQFDLSFIVVFFLCSILVQVCSVLAAT